MDQADIARLLQAHLRRVGCAWDEASRKALDFFNKNAKTKFDIKVASLDPLDFVRGKRERVCPLFCEESQKVQGIDEFQRPAAQIISSIRRQAREADGALDQAEVRHSGSARGTSCAAGRT
jgi:hypothetical protein